MGNILAILKLIFIPFIFVIILIPFISKFAIKVKAVDIPRKNHIHNKVTPKLGGLGIFFGFILGIILFGKINTQMLAIISGAIIILIFGVLDDIYELRPKTKLLGQILAALVVSVFGGILFKSIDAFGIIINFGIFTYPITIFFILGCINCMNLIDGIDGLSGGISSIYFLTIGIVAYIQGKLGNEFIISFIMLGSILGFLKYNFNPAKIFAGDSGSMFMGYMMSVIALLGFKNVTVTSFIVPILVLAIPILDTSFAIIRRVLKGEKITSRDEFHIHHELLHMNFTTKQTVLIIYFVDLLFAAASIVYVLHSRYLGFIIYGILLTIVVVFVLNTKVIYDFKSIKNKKKKRG